MNRNQRKYGRIPKRTNFEVDDRRMSPKFSKEIEEVFPPRSRREQRAMKRSRCCYTSPERRSIEQLTLDSTSLDENLLADEYGLILSDLATMAQRQKLRSSLYGRNQPKTERASQYSGQLEPLQRQKVDDDYGLPRREVDTVSPNDKFIKRDEETLTQYHNLSKNCRISDIPRVKVIADKFSKYKKNNTEVRKLEERVVCLEYDVFDEAKDIAKPVQKMRAFFSVKPKSNEKENVLTEMPPIIKNNFNVSSQDMRKLNQKEVEIIDGKILENQSYLEDLRKILLRRQKSANDCNNTINLRTLYEIAKRELLENEIDYDSNTLTKEEMLEVRNLILENCKSSVHGIRRRIVGTSSKASDVGKVKYTCENTISRSLISELLR